MNDTVNNEPEPGSEESPPGEEESPPGEGGDTTSAQAPNPLEESDPPIIIQDDGSSNP